MKICVECERESKLPGTGSEALKLLALTRTPTALCVYVALFARRLACNHYASAHANNAANTHAQSSGRAC